MGITERQWTLIPAADPQKASQLAAELGIDRVLADLLVQRGVESFEEARRFFRPRLEDLHDPFLMKDMDKAVERVHKAITGKEKILVYGDYDVDGTTAVAQVYSFLKQFTPKVDFYIPDRYDEGYGLSYKALDWASDNGIGLVITLDCGIKAIEKVEYARGKGIDVIICDHHLPENELPAAVAILDPKREDCHYPF
ncbi:MAG: DHH family phosphoesterase, partial [Bacteroidales bacterium]|nr:DHH family phosphoesterase [Bacteroidales bacterium]